jgi:hypothetical protein
MGGMRNGNPIRVEQKSISICNSEEEDTSCWTNVIDLITNVRSSLYIEG